MINSEFTEHGVDVTGDILPHTWFLRGTSTELAIPVLVYNDIVSGRMDSVPCSHYVSALAELMQKMERTYSKVMWGRWSR